MKIGSIRSSAYFRGPLKSPLQPPRGPHYRRYYYSGDIPADYAMRSGTLVNQFQKRLSSTKHGIPDAFLMWRSSTGYKLKNYEAGKNNDEEGCFH
jgi:hypothetical protein